MPSDHTRSGCICNTELQVDLSCSDKHKKGLGLPLSKEVQLEFHRLARLVDFLKGASTTLSSSVLRSRERGRPGVRLWGMGIQ